MRINSNQFNINFSVENQITDEVTAGEFFAGGGGWTSGIEKLSGVKTKWVLNHDRIALKTNAFHHKGVKVYWADVYVQDEHELEQVDYVHASIECTQHSNANGGRDKKIGSYTMGWELYRYLKYLQPLVISIENVPEFKKWSPLDENGKPDKQRLGEEFKKWKRAIMDLGYEYKESIRNAADDGLPTRRVRFFCFFYRPGIDISFPEFTHSKDGLDGKQKWESCRPHINTDDEGVSIFGRQFNESLKKHQRKPYKHNSLRRIAGGIRKLYPEFNQFLTQYYGGEDPNRFQSLTAPIYTIPTENRHQLITVEKLKFIMDHCHSDNYNTIEEPLNPQLTRQTKQMATVDVRHFLCQFYGGSDQTQSVDTAINTITGNDRHQLIRLEKVQFIAKYFNSNGHPENNVESLDDPLSTIMQEPKHQLITLLDSFDIKARFLRPDELASCSTFPRDYFSHPELKLSHKNAIKLIGNAVPPLWAEKLVNPNLDNIRVFKSLLKTQKMVS
ncbi:MAG: DNA cytosine methyltransferase [Arcticibacter sp.]